MPQNQSFTNAQRGVSPIIGVILMVAIVVILAAIIGVFVLSQEPQEPTGTYSITESATGSSYILTFDTVSNPANLTVYVDGVPTETIEPTVGGSLEITNIPAGSDIRLVEQKSETSATVYTSTSNKQYGSTTNPVSVTSNSGSPSGPVSLASTLPATVTHYTSSSTGTVPRDQASMVYFLVSPLPGDTGSVVVDMENQGSGSGTFTLELITLNSDENGINTPESSAGDTTSGPGNGEMLENFNIKIYTVDSAGNTNYLVGSSSSYVRADTLTLGDIATTTPVDGNEIVELHSEWEFPPSTGNEVQGDSIEIEAELKLDN